MRIYSNLSTLALLALMLFSFTACNNDTLENPDPTQGTVWTGATITFEKANSADPDAAENQDRITDNVWITRGNNGGQIYNVQEENNASKNNSPDGTLWAVGTIDNIENLTFTDFREAVGRPKNVVGRDLVVFLVEDEIYLSLKFTQWSQNKGGGFAYERSSE